MEVRFPATVETGAGDLVASDGAQAPPTLPKATATVRLFTGNRQQSSAAVHARASGETPDATYVLTPGVYTFAYDQTGMGPVYGEVEVQALRTARAKALVRHTSLLLTPSPLGHESVLTHADLDHARGRDVVAKVVFVADLPAVRRRVDDIDRGLRELGRLRGTLEDQKDFWSRKLAERRLNTRYNADFGWGVDVPGADLALLQALVGPERYHWHRFSEAEDAVHTYEEDLARLSLPERALREERDALKQVLSSADVLHRASDVMVLTAAMIRPYRDPVDEVETRRVTDTVRGGSAGLFHVGIGDWMACRGSQQRPYRLSSELMSHLSPGLRRIVAPSRAASKRIGEVIMIVQLGPRRPVQLATGIALSSDG